MNKSNVIISIYLLAVLSAVIILPHLPVNPTEIEYRIVYVEMEKPPNITILPGIRNISQVDVIIEPVENTSVPEFHFKQITRAELEQILSNTSFEYIPRNHSFVCVDITNELLRELLLKRGIQSCQAIIYFKAPTNHALLAVNTSDEGVLFVEAQNDNILNWNDLIFHYTYMTRVTSCFGRRMPEPYECVFKDGIKKCNLAHSW